MDVSQRIEERPERRELPKYERWSSMIVSWRCGHTVSICDHGLLFIIMRYETVTCRVERCTTFPFIFCFILVQDQHSSIFQHNASSLPTPTIHQHTEPIIVITTFFIHASSDRQFSFCRSCFCPWPKKMLVILRVQTRIHVQAPSFWHSVQVG